MKRSVPAASLVLALVLLAPAPVHAYQRPGRTEQITLTPGGLPGTAPDAYTGRRIDARVAVTADAALVAFDSRMTDLVEGDTNDDYDVFVRDRSTGRTELISVTTDGASGNGASHSPAITPDGRHVAFDSDASNLVVGDPGAATDIFVRDRVTGTTERISVSSSGTSGDQGSENPAISTDGRYVAFASSATNLVAGDTNGCPDIFVHDRDAGTTERVSVSSAGAQGSGVCTYGSTLDISADGRFVVFETQMHDLVPDDRNASWDIFVHDRVEKKTEIVSVASDGTRSNYVSYNPRINDDGRYVAFTSAASSLVPQDNNSSGPRGPGAFAGNGAGFDVFVHDRVTDRTERVSLSSSGAEGNWGSYWLDISGDGRYVAFDSASTTLSPQATSYLQRIYVHDRVTAQTEVVSVDDSGAALGAATPFAPPALTADGRYVAFATGNHVWLRDRGPLLGTVDLTHIPVPGGVRVTGRAALTGVTLTSAVDPADDAADPADHVGGELTGAQIVYRPEEDDLLFAIDVDSLPGLRPEVPATNYVVPGYAGSPGVIHAISFVFQGATYQVRAVRVNYEEPGDPPPALISLFKCEVGAACRELEHLKGGFGTGGDRIVGSVPIASLKLKAGNTLTDVRAYSALGDSLVPTSQQMDQMTLDPVTLPAVTARLGVAPAGTDEGSVVFDRSALVKTGTFSAFLPVTDPSQPTDGWARVCLGEQCSTAHLSLTS